MELTLHSLFILRLIWSYLGVLGGVTSEWHGFWWQLHLGPHQYSIDAVINNLQNWCYTWMFSGNLWTVPLLYYVLWPDNQKRVFILEIFRLSHCFPFQIYSNWCQNKERNKQKKALTQHPLPLYYCRICVFSVRIHFAGSIIWRYFPEMPASVWRIALICCGHYGCYDILEASKGWPWPVFEHGQFRHLFGGADKIKFAGPR